MTTTYYAFTRDKYGYTNHGGFESFGEAQDHVARMRKYQGMDAFVANRHGCIIEERRDANDFEVFDSDKYHEVC